MSVVDNRGSVGPFERVLSKLPEARPVPGTSQKAWKACCPAHADANPSLSVTQGQDGRALIHCYAGCASEAVVEALGLTMADLMPPEGRTKTDAGARGSTRTVRAHGVRPAAAASGSPVLATAEDAVAELERRMGPASRTWTYHDDYENPVGLILRWDKPDGKEIRPVSRTGDGWTLGGMPTPRPLYRLVELLKRTGERVYVAEGEKAADAAGSLGLLATTSPHGSNSASKADWRPLAGRDVAILPDNDEAGRRYAEAVAQILLRLEPPAQARIVALPEIGPGEDLHDWLERRDAVESETLRERLEKLVAATPVCSVPARASLPGDATAAKQEKTTPCGVPTNELRPLLTCVDDVEETNVRWLWPGRVALGRITLLVGRPGEGKSFLTTDMAAHVTRGTPWPDGTACPDGSVLLISVEDDPRDTIRPRLRAHGADLKRVYLLSTVERTQADGRPREAMFRLADVEALEAALAAHPDCRLVVVDPIGSFLGGETDAHRDNDVRSILAPVGLLAERHDAAVLVVAHRRKSPGANADDMALGSRAFTGVARAVWHLMRDPENRARRLLLSGKNNLAAEGRGLAFTILGEPGGLPSICWEREAVDMNADDAVRRENAPTEDGGTVVEATMTWLQDTLAQGSVRCTEVVEQAKNRGVSARVLKRAKHRLGVRSIKQGQDAWYWRLPESKEVEEVEGGQGGQGAQSWSS